jgi:hypothetical protein
MAVSITSVSRVIDLARLYVRSGPTATAFLAKLVAILLTDFIWGSC